MPERWCADLNACSNTGRCNALLASLAAAGPAAGAPAPAPAAPVYVPPVDKTPPKLKLLGGGTAAITPSGAAIMMDNVTWNAAWADPGATAMDAVDGNVTSRIQSLGVGECINVGTGAAGLMTVCRTQIAESEGSV